MDKKSSEKLGGETGRGKGQPLEPDTLTNPSSPHGRVQTAGAIPKNLKKLKNILSAMGEGLANQHLSESATTQDFGLLTWPTITEKEINKEHSTQDAKGLKHGASSIKRILVVGHEWGFSDVLISKALGLAQRNDCGIVALNVIPVAESFFSALSSNAKDEIMELVDKSVTKFREKVASMGIPFTHLTRVGKGNVVAEEVDNNLKSISFVLVDSGWKKETIQSSIAVHYMETASCLS
ncbi:MAG: universal stress protein [Magnetococcales bacterium]|nr:universal stress protein [Magnetococcales bacterium]